MFDYETLRLIWWLFLGVLLIGFAIMGGFDLGVAMLLPFLGKNDSERRVIINSIRATWEGNHVWFVTAGGALFAAWPPAYAVAFSGFYFALLLTLFALFLRPIGFDYRSKLPSQRWRSNWDNALFVGGFVPALIFGVAFGNLLVGVPFHFDNDMRIFYEGSFWGLLNPFALLAGLVSLSMLLMHGAVYLQVKTDDVIYQRCKTIVPIFAGITLLAFGLAGIWVANLNGYHISSVIQPNAASNPLLKQVTQAPGLWLDNYQQRPLLWLIPGLAFIAGIVTSVLSKNDRPGLAFISSSLMLSSIILTAGCAMFPFLIPSSSALSSSLTVWDASASHKTLSIIFWVTVIFLPLIIIYTSWVFRVLRGKITVAHIKANDHTAY
ncbi:MAG: cytochrome d ubiquinol oxidase subunit II [Methylococcales bacterium]|nr:cytochrome d ubiquinol oxidase subunit II [Methylococcales bacterium]